MTNNTTISHPFQDNAEWQRLQSGIIDLAKTEVLARFEQVTAEEKSDGSLLTEADTEMQKKTQTFLQNNWPQYAFLGEESSTEEQEAAIIVNLAVGYLILWMAPVTLQLASLSTLFLLL